MNIRMESLRSRLIVLVWGIVVALFIFETITVFCWFRNRYRREVANRVEIAHAIGLAFRGFVRDVLHQERAIGSAISLLSDPTSQQLQNFLQEIATPYEAVRLFAVVDSAGIITGASRPEYTGQSLADRTYFKQLKNGEVHAVSNLLRLRVEHLPGFVIARGFYDAHGELSFVVLAAVEARMLGKIALHMDQQERDYVTLFDGLGNLVYTDEPITFPDDSARNWTNSDRVLEKALTGTTARGFFTTPYGTNRRRVGARVPIGTTGWVAGDAMRVSEFLLPLLAPMAVIILAMVIVAAIAILVARKTINSVSEAVGTVQDHLRTVARGNYTTIYKPTGLNEFDYLVAVTNEMAVKLKEREERMGLLAAIVENSSDFIRLATSELVPFFINESGLRMVGLTEESDIENISIFDYFTPDDRETMKEKAIPTMQETGRWSGEVRLRNFDTGHEIPTLWSVFAVRDQQGELLAWATVSPNISELKEKEAALESANKELEAFSYSVSHDLRNPLNTIGTFTAVILEECNEKFDDTCRQYLELIEGSVRKTALIIDDMLTLSRVSRYEMNRTHINLSAKVVDILADLEKTDPNRSVEQVIEEDLCADADPRLSSLALENLIRNSWKFTAKTERPRIEFRVVSHEEQRVFVIRDNGAGFDMKHAEKLFLPFKRLHAEKEFCGTGIGLPIVERVIKRHGGKIWAQGEPGKGATFYFTLGEKDE